MKIPHLGIKISIAIMLGIIMMSYIAYWKTISTLSQHMESIITASDHLQNGEVFHSAVHSMMMDVDGRINKARYLEDRQTADNALLQLKSYLEHMADGMGKKMLSENTSRISKRYSTFRDYTEKIMLQENTGNVESAEHQVKVMFNGIFKEYKKMHGHHTRQRDDLLSKTQTLEKSIRLMLIVELSLSIIVVILVIIYLDRVVLKLFNFTEKLALHDKLTGLYNRHGLDRIVSDLEGPGGATRQKGYGLILLDIDHFKQFNDIYGHPAGDQLLVGLAKVLLKTVRAQDRVVRFGGEEILILIYWVDLPGTRQVAQKICKTIADTPFDLLDGTEPKNVTVSIGYAASSHDPGSFNDLIKNADQRLYEAKNSGRNRISGPLE